MHAETVDSGHETGHFDTLAAKSRDSLYLIDSTIVKAHRAASGAKGGSKSRRSAADYSEPILVQARENIALNQLTDRITIGREDILNLFHARLT